MTQRDPTRILVEIGNIHGKKVQQDSLWNPRPLAVVFPYSKSTVAGSLRLSTKHPDLCKLKPSLDKRPIKLGWSCQKDWWSRCVDLKQRMPIWQQGGAHNNRRFGIEEQITWKLPFIAIGESSTSLLPFCSFLVTKPLPFLKTSRELVGFLRMIVLSFYYSRPSMANTLKR